jgi:glutamate synthase domain-containing protein 3
LTNWSKAKNNFIKVMPTDYKRALEIMAKNKIEKII